MIIYSYILDYYYVENDNLSKQRTSKFAHHCPTRSTFFLLFVPRSFSKNGHRSVDDEVQGAKRTKNPDVSVLEIR